MSLSCIDHIVVTASSLQSGAEFIKQTLGADPQTGGEHPRMGTHNLLLRLGDSLFLEVIAVNPQEPAPARPRWFGLDNLRPDSPPALSTWVARSADIRTTAAASSEPLGAIERMTRGTLEWLIAIPGDGCVPLEGIGPHLIEWRTDPHPASRLKDHGLSLVTLEIFHREPARVSRLLESIEFSGPLTVSALTGEAVPYLIAHIETPQGLRRLSAQGSR